MEKENYDIHLISSMLKPLSVKWIYYLVRKADFDSLSKELKVWVGNATHELIESIGFSFDRKTHTLYLFTSEANLLSGMRALNPGIEDGARKILPVTSSPEVFFEVMPSLSPEIIEIDYSSSNGSLRLEGSEVKLFQEVAGHHSFCQFSHVYVIEEKGGYAFPMELDGKEYALVFLTEDSAKPTMEGLKYTNPGTRLKRNSLKTIIEGILDSPFEGLLLNPASEMQTTVSKGELELCLVLIDAVRGKAEAAPKRLLNKILGKKA